MTSQTSRTMMPISSRMVAALISRNEYTTWRVGSIGVRPARTMKVRNADSSAIATANGATHFRKIPPPDSVRDGSKGGAEVVSAVVIPAIGELKGLAPAIRGLMHSYHNVAKLRQFRGESDR